MQTDFHYYATYQLSRLAGYNRKEASTIAYASQYVDDATESEAIEVSDQYHFDTVLTAHYKIKSFEWRMQKEVFMPFHFLPPYPRSSEEPKFTYLTQHATGADNELATIIFKNAMEQEKGAQQLISLGIAIHTVADTFSHFGFTGRHHEENRVGQIWRLGKGRNKLLSKLVDFFYGGPYDIILPHIGHGEAGPYPDEPYKKWKYSKSVDGSYVRRDNHKQCLKGANLLYRMLKQAKSGASKLPKSSLKKDWPEDYQAMSDLFALEGDEDERCDNWAIYTEAPTYNKLKWRKEALSGNVDWEKFYWESLPHFARELAVKKKFGDSKWVKFHRGAFRQRTLVLEQIMY